MITKELLFDFEWIDSIILNLEIKKRDDSLSLHLQLQNEKKTYVDFSDCYYIQLNEYGYFVGNDSILDIDFFEESTLIQNEIEKKITPIKILNQISIHLNSGGSILCLVTENSQLNFKD